MIAGLLKKALLTFDEALIDVSARKSVRLVNYFFHVFYEFVGMNQWDIDVSAHQPDRRFAVLLVEREARRKVLLSRDQPRDFVFTAPFGFGCQFHLRDWVDERDDRPPCRLALALELALVLV